MSSVLKINKLTKKYGKLTALNQLDLSIEAGQVYGILGPNGSGKTTTLGMILEVVAPTSGSFEWFGGEDNTKARQKIGAILETPCFYSYLTAVQNLKIVAHIKQCGTDKIEPILKQVNLYERRNDKFKTYRKGEKLHEGAVDDILGETNMVDIASTDTEALAKALESFEGKEKLEKENGSIKVFLNEDVSSEDLNQFCFDQGISLKKLVPQSKSLEQEFLKILKEND